MTALAYTSCVPNGGVLQPTTSLSATMDIANAEPERTVIFVSNTDDDTGLTVTIKAGDYPPALASGQGDKVITVAFGTQQFLGPFESGRFLQNDGSMQLVSSVQTGKVAALLLPRAT